MRIFIHGIKSLMRRPAKTTMLLIILVVVFVLIFTGFIIQNSIKESKTYIRNQIGSAVEYMMDYKTAFSSIQSEGLNNFTRPPALSIKVAEKIASSYYVKNYFLTQSVNVNSDTIAPAETQQTAGGFIRNFSEFTLSGTNNIQNLDLVMGNVMLAEGRIFSEDELNSGSKVIIISSDVATSNDLRVGDTISLTLVSEAIFGQRNQNIQNNQTTSTRTPEDYEIIGFYDILNSDINVNTIFTSDAVINDINGVTLTDETNAGIVYILDDPNNVDAFIKENSPFLTSEYHELYSNDDEYNSLTKPLDLISFITSILIWVVFIAGAAIILAIVTIFVRDRKFEIGLLLSSGEGKLKIISQFIFEMLIIAIIAFVISAGSSSLISRSVSSWIVENQLLSQTSLIGSTSTTTTDVFQGRNPVRILAGAGSVSLYGDIDMQNVADEFDISLSAAVLIKLLLASIMLIFIGSCIPLIVITRFNPKQILQDY